MSPTQPNPSAQSFSRSLLATLAITVVGAGAFQVSPAKAHAQTGQRSTFATVASDGQSILGFSLKSRQGKMMYCDDIPSSPQDQAPEHAAAPVYGHNQATEGMYAEYEEESQWEVVSENGAGNDANLTWEEEDTEASGVVSGEGSTGKRVRTVVKNGVPCIPGPYSDIPGEPAEPWYDPYDHLEPGPSPTEHAQGVGLAEPQTPSTPEPAPIPPVPAPEDAATEDAAPPAPKPRPTTPEPGHTTPQPEPTKQPTTPPAGSGQAVRISGVSRVETAVQLAQANYEGGTPVVILARSDVHADSASAVPLAKHLNAPVLLTQPENLHSETLKALLQLEAAKVIIMGGPVAIAPAVEAQLIEAGFEVERVAGENRAGTAVATAEQLQEAGKAKEVILSDGFDWQPNMIAGPAAAKVNGVSLLTNGKELAPETAAFLANHPLPTTSVGDHAKEAFQADRSVVAADGAALSVAVAQTLFSDDAPAIGVATTADFADALTGGAHVALAQGPLLLSPETIPVAMVDWVHAADRQVFIYGGDERFSATEVARLNK